MPERTCGAGFSKEHERVESGPKFSRRSRPQVSHERALPLPGEAVGVDVDGGSVLHPEVRNGRGWS